MARGILITLEGIDGAGKTTLAQGLRDTLGREARPVRLLREPGGVPASERVRSIVSDPGLRVDPRAEALLFAAARAQLVQERLLPLLQAGALVLLDRFVDSSLVYQGIGRGLGVADVAAINAFATDGLTPDRTLLLVIDPDQARKRVHTRAQVGPPDRLEHEDRDFFRRLAAGYAELAAREPKRIRILDAGAPPDTVLAAGLNAISDLL